MKKRNFFAHEAMGLAVLAVSLMISCSSNDPDKLSAGTVEDLVEELLEESAQDQSYVTVRVGKYEENDWAARARLMQLQAAGVITYKVERFAWWNKTLAVDYTYRYYETVGGRYEKIGNVYYDFEEHIVVTVGLTDEGKIICVDSIPQPQPKVDKDMEQPEFNPADFPESKINLKENWKYIPNPDAPPAPANVKQKKEDTYDLGKALREEQSGVKESAPVEHHEVYDDEAPKRLSLDIKTSMAWEKLKDQLHDEDVILKSSRLKVKKARFIQIFDDKTTGVRCGCAEIIIEMTDVTPAGRVMEQKYDGIRLCAPVSLVFFYDKGWILQDKSLNLSAVSNLGIQTAKSGTIVGGDVSATAAKTAENMALGVPQADEPDEVEVSPWLEY